MAFVGRGIRCCLLDGHVANPIVPFGLRFLGATAGVMITACHNPATDNGYQLSACCSLRKLSALFRFASCLCRRRSIWLLAYTPILLTKGVTI
ncbi:hypothetical protein PCANC_09341 [Puccinia coronata f. sp. avenae]|uniref:Alpha-D-phosphohexomutase alpha/beta/alpha domain-containing protein n=1 Tax=Puccinia coronata f. sp. avenae TaxID=200324 RepID=A0A2N5SIE2_9BASI|nr:hypothetical protein PCASD_20971 [Puccinia coronata f. sp. avenae]PLW40455.1 hypothetical protein PCANC_09341 [Puccinia coronata f. sp. avenae]